MHNIYISFINLHKNYQTFLPSKLIPPATSSNYKVVALLNEALVFLFARLRDMD